MSGFPLENLNAFRARALYIAERIETRSLETTSVLGIAPLTFTAGEAGCAVLFRYGVAVLFNLTSLEEVSFLRQLEGLLSQPFEQVVTEELEIRIQPDSREGMKGNRCYLKEVDLERIQVIAEILARNAVLTHYEPRVAEAFDSIEPFAIELKGSGRYHKRAKELLRHIGESLLIEQKMVGRVEVGEKPEVLWESPALEGLYGRLEDEYELRERQIALERKLALISRTAETVLDLLQTWRSLRVEWYIVILIIFEILLTLYEMFLKNH
jgi:uncharacterized Rmd1/YagE family protein